MTKSNIDESEAREFLPSRKARTWRVRVWRYAPLVVWLGFIFFASTASLSASNTSRIIRPLLLWLFPDITEATLLQAHFLVRKASHFTEYAILALLAARTFIGSSRAYLSRRPWLNAFLLVATYALLDEYHQSFVPSRTASVYDSMIDMTGGACALVVLWLMVRRRRRRRRQLEEQYRER